MRPTLACCLASLMLATSAGAHAVTVDPYLWLEDVEGDKALDWVRAQNVQSQKVLTTDPGFETLRGDLRAILDSDARIPDVDKLGDYFYNFWRDKKNPAGLWRRTTLAEYRKATPQWEVLIDLDALNAVEGVSWVWHGVDCLKPDNRRCLIALSRGGSDADITREYDLAGKTWMVDGFSRPEAKGSLAWRDSDSVFVSTDFGPGSMTTSGYPRIAKLWKRGTPMADASTIYEAEAADLGAWIYRDHTPGFKRDFVMRVIAFYNDELFQLLADGTLAKVDAPNNAKKSIHRQFLILELREPLVVGDKTYPAGALLAANFDAYMKGAREFKVLFEPTATRSLAATTWTRNHLLLNVLEDVKSRITVLTPHDDGRWDTAILPGTPELAEIAIDAVDDETSDDYFMTVSSYLTPTSLLMGSVGKSPELL